jgi:hypothetical protein
LSLIFVCFSLGASQRELAAQTVNITTAQQDTPTICSGCVYRSGQNLSETAITYGLTKDT